MSDLERDYEKFVAMMTASLWLNQCDLMRRVVEGVKVGFGEDGWVVIDTPYWVAAGRIEDQEVFEAGKKVWAWIMSEWAKCKEKMDRSLEELAREFLEDPKFGERIRKAAKILAERHKKNKNK